MNAAFYRIIFLLLCLLPAAAVPAQSLKPADETAIRLVLKTQSEAWNRGDLEGFMKGYLESDSLVFIGSKGLTYGWQATLDNYRRGYPDRAAMGQLTFTLLEMKALGKKNALVIGKWHLARPEKGDLSGHFSLTWRKTRTGWVIIADHSS